LDVLFALLWSAIAILAAGFTVYALVVIRGPLLPFMGTTGFGARNLIVAAPLALIAVFATWIAYGLGRGSTRAAKAAVIGSITLALICFALRIVGWPVVAGVAALHLLHAVRVRRH